MGWGGKRKGSGRPKKEPGEAPNPGEAPEDPPPPPKDPVKPAAEPRDREFSPDEVMYLSMRALAAKGHWAEASKAAKRLADSRRAPEQGAAGKKQAAADAAAERASAPGRFAVPPPPRLN